MSRALMSRTLFAAAFTLALAACKDAPPPAQAAAPKPVPTVVAASLAPIPAPDPNEALVLRVRQALEEAGKIDAAGIDVVVSEGTVSLWGTTGTKAELVRAGEVAQRVDGVKSVDNRLVVMRGS
jgi:hypothetical protein